MILKRHTLIRIIFLVLLGITSSSVYNPGNAQSNTVESPPIAIVFDLGGVLVETNYPYALWYMGVYSLFMRTIVNNVTNRTATQPPLRQLFYQTLNKISNSSGNPYGACDEEGNLLPALFCDWLCSNQTNKELKNLVIKKITQHPEWFQSSIDQALIANMATMIFNPRYFIKTRTLNPEGVAFIKKCQERGYQLYILSNWDAESFNLLTAHHADFFSLFDGIIISGNTHVAKPDSRMYNYFINHKEVCWIIVDDQKENIIAARKNGLTAIRCKRTAGIFPSSADFAYLWKEINHLEQKINHRHAVKDN